MADPLNFKGNVLIFEKSGQQVIYIAAGEDGAEFDYTGAKPLVDILKDHWADSCSWSAIGGVNVCAIGRLEFEIREE